MESIIIHTETKEQTKIFEQMAKVMKLSVEKESSLIEEFSKAIDLELAEKLAISNIKKVWKKLR